jgi:hypothetical protein
MTDKNVNEGLGDLAHAAEQDHEVQMARADLYKTAKYAIKLHDMLKNISEAEGLEGWVQAKITKAADYIGSVYHYLEYENGNANESKSVKGNMTEDQASQYKETLAERMNQKKTELGELSPDTLYKYHGKAYDDEAERRGSGDASDENKRKIANRKKGRALAATKHNKAKGWTRPTGDKKDASMASKAAAALAKLMARKDRQSAKTEESLDEATHWEVSYDHGPHQSNTVSVKAKSKEEALDKAKQVAKDVHKHNRITSIAVSPKKNESLDEKAKSKAQQRFMGMVHATQKGEPAPSKEVAKVAKEMPKKAAKDYAATKHKGKPEHVKK